MTVGELKKLLRDTENDALVILASDEEGNHLRALYQVSPDSVTSIEHGEYEANPADVRANSVILWPA